jgi:hypothetical protein
MFPYTINTVNIDPSEIHNLSIKDNIVMSSSIKGIRNGDFIFEIKERSDICRIKMIKKTLLFKIIMRTKGFLRKHK